MLPLLFLTLAIAPTPGRWECQSMGADTEANVSVRGDEVLIYRAMYPEFEGKPYKLEHLFKLKLRGTKLTGQLLVRDDPRDQFTALRAIEGELISEGELRLDGTPFKLLEAGEVKSPAPRRRPRCSAISLRWCSAQRPRKISSRSTRASRSPGKGWPRSPWVKPPSSRAPSGPRRSRFRRRSGPEFQCPSSPSTRPVRGWRSKTAPTQTAW